MKSFLIYLILVSFTLSGCNSCKTAPDTNDKTPPSITWNIQNRTQKTQVDLNGNASYAAKYGDDLLITACGIDAGGVKEIVHYSSSSYSCRSGEITQQVGPGLVVPATTPLGLDQNGNAWKSYCIFLNMNLRFGCSSGFSFSSGSATANLKVTNYSNLATTANLVISVSN